MFGVEAREASLGLQDVLGMDEDIGRLPLESAERLMDVEAGIGERRALAGLMEAGLRSTLRLFLPDLNELSPTLGGSCTTAIRASIPELACDRTRCGSAHGLDGPLAPSATRWAAAGWRGISRRHRRCSRIWRNHRDSGSVHPFPAASEREHRTRKSPARRDPSPPGPVPWCADQRTYDAK
jgi:hypothetical protein